MERGSRRGEGGVRDGEGGARGVREGGREGGGRRRAAMKSLGLHMHELQ